MFTKAVFATSLSEVSGKVLSCLGGLKKLGVQELVLAHVLDVHEIGGLYDELRKLAQPRLEQQRRTAESMGFVASAETRFGFAYVEINRLAAEKGADLIVLFASGETLTGDVFMGGIAHEVLDRMEIPCLVFKARLLEEAPGRCEVVCGNLVDSLLYPTDFSDNAAAAFRVVAELVRRGARKVTLVHVQDKVRIETHLKGRLEEFTRIDRERLEGLKRQLQEAGPVEVDVQVPYGFVTQELLRIARGGCHQLVVMGSQGRGMIAEVFLGSVSHNMIRHTELPVMLIPARQPA